MIDRFTAAKLKIKRANKHIAELDKAIAAIPNANVPIVEAEITTGLQQLQHFLPDGDAIAGELAVIIGDAIHNLRTALDYAWAGVIERHICPPDDYTKFPLYPTVEELKGALKGRKIDSISPILFERIVSNIRPYRAGGNEAIAKLHDLDVRDKHLLLLPVAQMVSVEGIVVQDEQGTPRRAVSVGFRGSGKFTITFDSNYQVTDKGNLAVEIVFDDGDVLKLLKAAPVSSILKSLSKIVHSVIEILENI
jgi:hypothetical protein